MTPETFQFEPTPTVRPRTHGPHGSRLARTVAAGTVLALLLRLALLLPDDLYARVIGRALDGSATTAGRAPTAGWDFWRLGPMTEASGDMPSVIDPGFLRHFVFATWWIGAVAGLVLVWRAGGRATDVACGVVAGSAAGVAGAATLGCLTVLFDGLPRAILSLFNVPTASPWLVTPLWVVLRAGQLDFPGRRRRPGAGASRIARGSHSVGGGGAADLDLADVRPIGNGDLFRSAITIAARIPHRIRRSRDREGAVRRPLPYGRGSDL